MSNPTNAMIPPSLLSGFTQSISIISEHLVVHSSGVKHLTLF